MRALKYLPLAAVLIAAPLGFTLALNHAAANFTHGEAFAREAPLDIAFLEVHPGPALCEDLTLCYWAEKSGPVDVFNLSGYSTNNLCPCHQLNGLLELNRIVFSSSVFNWIQG